MLICIDQNPRVVARAVALAGLMLSSLTATGAPGEPGNMETFDNLHPERSPAGWRAGGSASEMAIWKAEGGSDGSGLIGIIDDRNDTFASWFSPAIPLDFADEDSVGDGDRMALAVRLHVRHRIEEGRMRIVLRSFSEGGRQVEARNVELYSGVSEGWNDGRFKKGEYVVTVPGETRAVRLEMVSGGGAHPTGEIYLDAIGIAPASATDAGGALVGVPAQLHGVVEATRVDARYNAEQIPNTGTLLLKDDFNAGSFGTIPAGWRDLSYQPPSRNWAVDAQGYLRPVLKNWQGIISYEGHLTSGENARDLRNYVVRSGFKTTADSDVFFGIAGRIQDVNNFYTVRLIGNNRVRILKVMNGEEQMLSELVLLRRYPDGSEWKLEASFYEDLITGIVRDDRGRIVARLDGRDGEFRQGTFGLNNTEFAAAADVHCYAQSEVPTVQSVAEARDRNTTLQSVYGGYELVHPIVDHHDLLTSFDALDEDYDIVVAGAGSGGWAVAIQAARMGRRVLMLEETDWLGGQMGAAGTTSMDEAGSQVRERGLYREFHESIATYYYGLNKSPFKSYYHGDSAQNQMQGGYEPAIVQAILYGYIHQVRQGGGRLDLAVRTTVSQVHRENGGDTVTGATIRRWDLDGEREREIRCRILIDATEYGDVIPLTGAPYRVGNTRTDNLNLDGPVQAHSFNIVFREYPDGIPEHLRMKTPPPTYETERRRFTRGQIHGDWYFHRNERNFRILMAWRGAADSHGPLTGRISEERHTAASTNWANNYAVSARTIESLDQRYEDERTGVYRMLSLLYYIQNELGLPWSAAEEQGFDTPYNQLMMERRGISEEIMPFARLMCQIPYVRESRRIIGVDTLVAADLTRWDDAKHMSTSVAMGDYFMDLHGTYEGIEADLDGTDHPRGNGPFQVPFEVFIPRQLDGFLTAEKNFSQSRLVSGATRLQPITILTGQAVGMIAALAIEKGVQPRALKPVEVQLALLEQGSTLVQRWYKDVDWGTDLWRAVQLLSLYEIIDHPGGFAGPRLMSFQPANAWGSDEALTLAEAEQALHRLREALGVNMGEKVAAESADGKLSRGEFAVALLRAVQEEVGGFGGWAGR
jgi:hypothetical protein